METEIHYVLVTPVRDEVATIGRTIQAVLGQTLRPREWVIVSDGSTDGTDEIIRQSSSQYPWIRLLPLQSRVDRSFASVVKNTEAGIHYLNYKDYRFIGLLDADVIFQNNYFEQLMRRFNANPTLGLAGGVVIDIGLPRDRFPRNRMDIPGAVQFFSRECLASIGRLIPIAEGGWDGVTCTMARMHGYQTRLFTDLVVDHLKPRNISEGGVVRRKWQMGVRDYVVGYHPVFEAFKCASRLSNPPLIIGAIAWWIGYCIAASQSRTRVVDSSVVAYLRQEQLRRLFRMVWP